jgi:hypothetical protein
MTFQFRRSQFDALNTIARAVGYILRHGDNALKHARAERSDDFDLHESIQTRAAVVPSSTSNTSGAFNQTAVSDVGAVIGPASGFTQFTARALAVSRGANAGFTLPYALAASGTMGFVPQGSPLSVKQWTFNAGVTIAARKIAGIIPFTNDLDKHSEAATFFKALMIENTARSVDALFFDANADDGVRPAGLRSGVTALTSAGSTSMVADLTTLAAAVASKASSLDDIVYIASVDIAAKIAIAQPLLKMPVISTAGLASGTIAAAVPSLLAIEAAPEIQFSVSDSTALVMDDAPGAISTVGTPPVVSAPVRSLYQTDCRAIRLIFEIDYKWRTTGAIAWMQSIAW